MLQRITILMLLIITFQISGKEVSKSKYTFPNNRFPSTWVKVYQKKHSLWGKEVIQLPDNSAFIVASTDNHFLEKTSYLIRIDSQGKILEENKITFPGFHMLTSPILLLNKSVLFCGMRGIDSKKPPFIWLYEVNNVGRVVWQKLISHKLPAILQTITSINYNNFILSGYVFDEKQRLNYPILMKINRKGKIIWERILSNQPGRISNHILTKKSIIGVGSIKGKAVLLRFSLNGKLLQKTTFPFANGFSKVISGPKNCLFISGFKYDFGYQKAVIAKLTIRGKLLKKKSFRLQFKSSIIADMKLTKDNHLMVTGWDQSSKAIEKYAHLIRLDKNLKIIWGEIFNEETCQNSFFYNSTLLKDGGILAIGGIGRSFKPKLDLLITKFVAKGFSKANTSKKK